MAGHRVLVTGSAGVIGNIVCQALLQRPHHVRGFDRKPNPILGDNHVGDLKDKETVARAAEAMDTVVHLGATPDDADFLSDILPNNIMGTYHVFEAARQNGIKRVIYASSTQTVQGLRVKDRPITVADGTAPRNTYAVSKVFGETLAHLYAHKFGITCLCVRIAFLPRNPNEARQAKKSGPENYYFSHADAARFFTRAVEAELPDDFRFAVLFALSRGMEPYPRFDLKPAQALIGYEPQDSWPEGLPFAVE